MSEEKKHEFWMQVFLKAYDNYKDSMIASNEADSAIQRLLNVK
jgi:hypothetical protein